MRVRAGGVTVTPCRLHDRFQPLGGPGALCAIVDPSEGLKAQHVDAPGGEVVVPGPAPVGQGPHRVPDIEDEHLRLRVAEELGGEQREQHRFAGARLSEHQRVPHIGIVEVHAERGGPRTRGPKERRALRWVEGARVRSQPGPDARHRQEIGEVPGGEEGPPEVRIAMPREAAEIGVERIHRLDPPREPGVVQGFENLPRDLVRPGPVGLHHDRDLREGAEPHRPARVLGQRVRRILRQAPRVLIEPERLVRLRHGRPLPGDELLHPGGRPLPLLEPLELVAPDLFRRHLRPEREHAVRPAKGEGEGVREVALPRVRCERVALHRHRANREAPDPGLEAAHELLVGKHGVQVGPMGRRPDRVRKAGEALVQVGQQPVSVEALHV